MSFVNISLKSVLSMSPQMLGAYGLVIGVGGACIISALLERHMVGTSNGFISKVLDIVLKVGMPVGYAFMLIRFLFSL